MRRWRLFVSAVAAGLLATGLVGAGASGTATGTTLVNWPQYLYSPDHLSANAGATTITPAKAAHLFLAGLRTTINGVKYAGSVRQVNPATGSVIWQTGLTGKIIGTPTIDGAGVIAASSYGSRGGLNALWLINATTGQILKTISYGSSSTFAQPVFADGYLFTASQGPLGLQAYTVHGG